MPGIWSISWALLAALFGAGGLCAGVSVPWREEFRESYLLAAGERVAIDNRYGDVRITGWDRDEVRVEAVKTSPDSMRVQDARIVVDRDSGRLAIHTQYFGAGEQPATVEYRISVPRAANLESVRLGNGVISLKGLSGPVRASAVNGDIRAEKLGGQADLSTVNGRLDVDFERLDRGAPISLRSVNGPITLSIPAGAGASLEARNLSGGIRTTVGRVWRAADGHSVRAVVNRGGAPIQVRNINGGITVHSIWARPGGLARRTGF